MKVLDQTKTKPIFGHLSFEKIGVKDLRKQNILFAQSFLRRLHKSRVSFAQHSLTNFTCLLLKVVLKTSS
ncbi:hypothetical protein SUGI_1072360 [Cryptomeria japonica]|nr:hypothetical protein SUGI_1072360 [Cryptomeria japonica]